MTNTCGKPETMTDKSMECWLATTWSLDSSAKPDQNTHELHITSTNSQMRSASSYDGIGLQTPAVLHQESPDAYQVDGGICPCPDAKSSSSCTTEGRPHQLAL
jgi:hypothetical protein